MDTKINSRVMMKLIGYFSSPGERTVEENASFHYFPEEEILPYVRKYKVKEITKVDFGWVGEDKAGIIIIKNITGLSNTTTYPSQEEKDEAKSRLLYVLINEALFTIENEQFNLFSVKDFEGKIYLLGPEDKEVKAEVSIFPCSSH